MSAAAAGLVADLVAIVHALAVVLLVTGGLVALRHRRVLWLHVPVATAIAVVFLAGADCPLTSLELALREQAGSQGYDGGFLGHYLLSPLGLDRAAAGTQLVLLLGALLPNALAGALLVARRSQARAVAAQTG